MMKKIALWLLAFMIAAAPALADIMPTPFVFVNAARFVRTVATGGTSQTGLVANPGRKLFCVINYVSATESVWIDYGEAAVVGSSQEVPAGSTLCFGGSAIYNQAITLNATTTSHQVTFFEFQ